MIRRVLLVLLVISLLTMSWGCKSSSSDALRRDAVRDLVWLLREDLPDLRA